MSEGLRLALYNLTAGDKEPNESKGRGLDEYCVANYDRGTAFTMACRGFTLLSWNIWFDRFQMIPRCEAVSRLIQERLPSVVCLQEVTPLQLQCLSRALSDLYAFSPYDEGCSYSTLTMARKGAFASPVEFVRREFRSEQGRFLQAVMLPGGGPCVVNLHLESLSNHDTRIDQLKTCRDFLSSSSLDPAAAATSILCGDFNFCSYRNYRPSSAPLENDDLARIFPDWRDVWRSLRPATAEQEQEQEPEPGYTFDSALNTMLSTRAGGEERMRYDRVILSPSPTLRAVSIELVGTEPISRAAGSADVSGFSTPPPSDLRRDVFCSDHFGIFTTFEQQD